MKPFYLLLIVVLTLPLRATSFCGSPSTLGLNIPSLKYCQVRTPADSLSYTIIPGAGQTFGYDIFLRGKLLVHQPMVPCVQGRKGFVKKEDAQKLALLVIGKIRKNIMPPTVTTDEMKQLGIAF